MARTGGIQQSGGGQSNQGWQKYGEKERYTRALIYTYINIKQKLLSHAGTPLDSAKGWNYYALRGQNCTLGRLLIHCAHTKMGVCVRLSIQEK